MSPSTANPQGPEPRPKACPEISRRGGRRPGAGAPKGNLNALKHGRRSTQFAEIGVLLATVPQAREALLILARRHALKQRSAEKVAALLLQRLIERAYRIQTARLNAPPPIDERRSINQSDTSTPATGYAPRPQPENHPPPSIEPPT